MYRGEVCRLKEEKIRGRKEIDSHGRGTEVAQCKLHKRNPVHHVVGQYSLGEEK